MADLTLIHAYFAVSLLAIFIQICKCEISAPPNLDLYTEARFPPKNPGYGSVIYVPVCRPDCFTSSHPPQQSHFSSNCADKAHVGSLPLQNVPSYPDEVIKDIAGHRQIAQSDFSKAQYNGQVSSQSYHLASDVSSPKHHSGSVTVYQQTTGHRSEQKHSIHHEHGVSHQLFKQEHQPSHASEVHDHGHEHSEDLHHKKDANYQFEYSVHDQKTGDVKRHREERKGDVVNGEYSLLEDDGNVRTVKYYADWKSGFHAQVHNSKPKSLG